MARDERRQVRGGSAQRAKSIARGRAPPCARPRRGPSASCTRRCRARTGRPRTSGCRRRRGSASCCRSRTIASCRSRRGSRRRAPTPTRPWPGVDGLGQVDEAGGLQDRAAGDGYSDSEHPHTHAPPVAEIHDVGDGAHRAEVDAVGHRAEDERQRERESGDEERQLAAAVASMAQNYRMRARAAGALHRPGTQNPICARATLKATNRSRRRPLKEKAMDMIAHSVRSRRALAAAFAAALSRRGSRRRRSLSLPPQSALRAGSGSCRSTSYDRADGIALSVYQKDGRHYIVGTPGHEYVGAHPQQHAAARVLVVTSVDGVNVISGDTASPGAIGVRAGPWGRSRSPAGARAWSAPRRSISPTSAIRMRRAPAGRRTSA